MTKLLEKAFKKASKLSEVEQNMLAKWLIDELESENKWSEAFAESEDVLDLLGNEALDANKKDSVTSLNVNKL